MRGREKKSTLKIIRLAKTEWTLPPCHTPPHWDYELPTGSGSSAGFVVIQFVKRVLDSLRWNIAHFHFTKPDTHTKSRNFGMNKLVQWTRGKDADVFDVDNWSAAKDCSADELDFENSGDHLPAYAMLDGLLKGSLGRLKTMRESFCLGMLSDARYYLATQYSVCVQTLRTLCTEGKFGAALWLRKNMMLKGVVPDLLCHNHLLSGLCRYGYLDKADSLFREMLEMGPSPNCLSYNCYIGGYCLSNNVDKALHIFSSMVNANVQPNMATCNILVHALCQKGFFEDAWKLLKEIINEDHNQVILNIISSTIIMDGYFKNGDVVQAANLWSEISQKNWMDVIAYNVLIHGLLLNGCLKPAMGSICKMLKTGFLPDIVTYNTLLSRFCKEGKFDEASKIYEVISTEGITPDRISYKVLIQGLAIHGDVNTATKFFKLMLKESLVPEPLIWNCLIDCYGKCGDIKKATALKDEMLGWGVEPNVFTYNALICAEVKRQNLAVAYSLKTDMESKGILPDVVTYNLLIGGACDLNYSLNAVELHNEMLRKGCEPDIVTFTELISGHCVRGDLAGAEYLLTKVLLKSGLPFDDVPLKILVKRYLKEEKSAMTLDLFQKLVNSKQ